MSNLVTFSTPLPAGTGAAYAVLVTPVYPSPIPSGDYLAVGSQNEDGFTVILASATAVGAITQVPAPADISFEWTVVVNTN